MIYNPDGTHRTRETKWGGWTAAAWRDSSTGMSTDRFGLGPKTGSGREPADEIWRHTLARIATLFGRLVYLSSLHNPRGAEYSHLALAKMVGEAQAEATLRRSHAQVFQDWLILNLEQQKADLQEYLAELPDPAAQVAALRNSPSYQNLVPPMALDAERQLFAADIETLLCLLRPPYGASTPGSAA